MRLPLYVTLLSALIALVLSAPSVPLRGSLSTQSSGSTGASPVSGVRNAAKPSALGEEPKEEKPKEEGSEEASGGGVVTQPTSDSETQETPVTGTQQQQSQEEQTEDQREDSTTPGQGVAGDGHTPTGSEADVSHTENSGAQTENGEGSDASGSVSGETGEHNGTTGDNAHDQTNNSGGHTDGESSTGSSTGSSTSSDAVTNQGGDQSDVSTGAGSTTDGSGSGSHDAPASPTVVCGEKFTIWFSDGVPVTTVDCGAYTGIYYPTTSGGGEPKYTSETVTDVKVENNVIKVNGKELSSISVGSGAEGETEGPAKSRSRRSLQEEVAATEVADVYSFTAGGKSFTVRLPKEADEKKRNKYFLADDGGDVIFEGTKKEEFHFDNEGDLLDSQNNVILQSDESTSSAFALKYIIPSISAFVLSILLF